MLYYMISCTTKNTGLWFLSTEGHTPSKKKKKERETGSVNHDLLCRLQSIKSSQVTQTFPSRSADEKWRVGRFSRLAIRELDGRERRQRKNHPLKSSTLAKPPQGGQGVLHTPLCFGNKAGKPSVQPVTFVQAAGRSTVLANGVLHSHFQW